MWWDGVQPASWEPPDCAIHQLYLKAAKARQTKEFPGGWWLGPHAFMAKGVGSIPGWATKFPQATGSKTSKHKTINKTRKNQTKTPNNPKVLLKMSLNTCDYFYYKEIEMHNKY